MLVLIIIFFLLFFPITVRADVNSRLSIEPNPSFTGNAGATGLNIKAKLTISESDNSPSVGERAEFRIASPRSGDVCNTLEGQASTDSTGYIYATCTATDPGTVTVAAYSLDSTDWSSEANLTFNSVPSPTTPVTVPTTAAPTVATSTSNPNPTSTPTSKPVLKQSTTTKSQGGGFGGPGLVDDKEDTSGLGSGVGQTLGATESQDVSSAGDKDLLSTLIFLTGAVILVVWTIYAILVQKGVIKSIKKKENSGGITPQPLP